MYKFNLFDDVDSGAIFSECRRYRYALWRIWDKSKPYALFIGLNPSKANETEADNTIKSVTRITKSNGFGGFYMMNCFPYVSTNPEGLNDFGNNEINDRWLIELASASKCETVVFAWGAFNIVKDTGRDKQLEAMFPNAKCLDHLKDGSPKHPLYCRSDTKFIQFK